MHLTQIQADELNHEKYLAEEERDAYRDILENEVQANLDRAFESIQLLIDAPTSMSGKADAVAWANRVTRKFNKDLKVMLP